MALPCDEAEDVDEGRPLAAATAATAAATALSIFD
jgi:hypothetical protein